MSDQVGLPLERLRALVTLVLPFPCLGFSSYVGVGTAEIKIYNKQLHKIKSGNQYNQINNLVAILDLISFE